MNEHFLDVVVTRGHLVESRHAVHGIALRHDGTEVCATRDPSLRVWWRSCAKPLQLLPLLELGLLPNGWGQRELAIACGSHGGEPEHVQLVSEMLASINMTGDDLACGPHEPLSQRGARLLREGGAVPTRVHNNCSGKHTAMLALARGLEVPTEGYHLIGHIVQDLALRSLAHWSGVASSNVSVAIDGCGVPVFGTELRELALTYARLGHSAHGGGSAPQAVLGAMAADPFLVGGTDRFDTVLMQACEGAVIVKVGAEGVHVFAHPATGIGGAVKVADGSLRAQQVAVLRLMVECGVFPRGLPPAVEGLLRVDVMNTRGDVVGVIAPAVDLARGDAASAVKSPAGAVER